MYKSSASKSIVGNIWTSLPKEWIFFFKQVIRYSLIKNSLHVFVLNLDDGEYDFLDLILFFVNHFWLLHGAAPSSLEVGC